MRNLSALVIVAVSLLLGLVAVAVALKWLDSQAGTDIDTSRLVVASREIAIGTRLSPDFLKTVDWPSGSLPDGVFHNVSLLEGRVARVNLQRGEPLFESKLAPEGVAGGLSGVIADGKRAITVRVNDVVGVAGFALPGSLVDILISTRDEDNQPISKIVLEKILVLATAQDLSRDESKPRVVNAVTLEVTPEQAERIDLARSVGTLSLVLRNQLDLGRGETQGVRPFDLLGLGAAEPCCRVDEAAVFHSPDTPLHPVEIIRGLHRTHVH